MTPDLIAQGLCALITVLADMARMAGVNPA